MGWGKAASNMLNTATLHISWGAFLLHSGVDGENETAWCSSGKNAGNLNKNGLKLCAHWQNNLIEPQFPHE